MRKLIIYTLLAIITTATIISSCEKAASEKDYGFSKIFMPQAIFKSGGTSINYPVPSGTDSSTYNYEIDAKEKKLNVILGATLSGVNNEGFSVDIKVDNDTIQQLLTTNVLDPALYKILPASMYSLPASLEVAKGALSGTFNLSVDIPQLKLDQYIGKFLVLAVKLANPSKYELNGALSTTIVVIDVNALVIGPAVNITNTYILNPGGPFIASAMNGSRWGTLKDWKANATALSHGGVGGFSSDGDGATMDLESGWGSPLIANGKIYQTINLPAGTYAFDPSGGAWKWQGTKDAAYVVVAPALDTLPDYNMIVGSATVMYKQIAQPQPLVYFELGAPGKVTLGIVVNYVQDQQGIKSTKVALYNYPKHL
ncbi:DUF5013 domain-containing protein [Niastella sp. OAS944]|uniref:DUF5013 domain-containing protein n=1 Tax=Niastella sp. OAS944 TaxID=2664089 RepID=UPI0034715756|nr:hypothetical protein [Chitinophagaceae bacterium OAS944]